MHKTSVILKSCNNSDYVSPQSHIVETSEGAVYRRTSQHIRKSPIMANTRNVAPGEDQTSSSTDALNVQGEQSKHRLVLRTISLIDSGFNK